MAVSKLHSRIGELGIKLAQTHYANTSDLDGPLPWMPTDADLTKLVELLERAPTLEEIKVFQDGYREAIGRLDGNAHDRRINAVLKHELFVALARYGILLPADGTPERLEAEAIVTEAMTALRERMDGLLYRPNLDGAEAPTASATGG